MSTFSGKQLGQKTRPLCTSKEIWLTAQHMGELNSWLHYLRIQILYSYWILITGWLSVRVCVCVFQHILQSQKVIT